MGKRFAADPLKIGVVGGVLAGHSVAEIDGQQAARMAQANSGRPAGLAPLGMRRENMLEARYWTAKSRNWWRPTEVLGRKSG